MKHACSAAALALLLAAGCQPAPAPVPEPPPARITRVEVLWDTYGVPHIYAQDAVSAVYASGWAQMRAHGDLLLRLLGQARGRAAEYWGESYVESDVWVRTNGVPARAAQWLAQQEPYERALLDAFVAGVNAYATAHGDSLAADVRGVLPVQAVDVLAHVQRTLHFTFLADANDVAGARRAFEGGGPGSNAWAIAPARSASGNALLLANPHLPWGDLYTWFESHLNSPELSVYGATLLGFPLPGIAFNDSLGWTFTVNTLDAADLYRLELRGDGYVMDSVYRPFETEQQVLRVRAADGTLVERRFTIRRSVHGPVVAATAAEALALRVAGLDAPHLVAQLFEMNRAQNLQQFESAVMRLQLPLFNILYADARGRIMAVFNGRVPIRQLGDAAFWRGTVPGNTARTLWTETYAYNRLPRVVNPPTGWLQNANDPPWTYTLPPVLDPARYPAAFSPPVMSFRAQRSARMLAEDDSITFDELVAYKHSTRLEMADHVLEDVVHAARTYGGPLARQAADVLEGWDRTADAQSRGGVLFAAFAAAARREPWAEGSPFDVRWTIRAPLATPDGLSDARVAASVLERAAEQVRSRYGALDVAWGDVYRLRRDALDLPASGGGSELGSFRVFGFEPAPGNKLVAASGDSYVAAIEFGSPVRAKALLTYGNASQPGSPHRTDQLPLAARQQLRDVWLTRADVEQNLKVREWF
jgi:acyl-homoserine-lactone acylase